MGKSRSWHEQKERWYNHKDDEHKKHGRRDDDDNDHGHKDHWHNKNFIRGTKDDDIIQGSGDGDKIFGGRGDDFIRGGNGNDHIFGGSGDDNIGGGNGHDFLFGGRGNDIVNGGKDSDFLSGGSGDDRITGGSGGNDFMHGGRGADTFRIDATGDETVVLDFDFREGDRIELKNGYGFDDVTIVDNGRSVTLTFRNDDGLDAIVTLRGVKDVSDVSEEWFI